MKYVLFILALPASIALAGGDLLGRSGGSSSSSSSNSDRPVRWSDPQSLLDPRYAPATTAKPTPPAQQDQLQDLIEDAVFPPRTAQEFLERQDRRMRATTRPTTQPHR